LLLIATVWAIVNVVQSDASTGGKVAWVVLLLLIPVITFLVWLFIGPRSVKRA
jgi:hypothetical protein